MESTPPTGVGGWGAEASQGRHPAQLDTIKRSSRGFEVVGIELWCYQVINHRSARAQCSV